MIETKHEDRRWKTKNKRVEVTTGLPRAGRETVLFIGKEPK